MPPFDSAACHGEIVGIAHTHDNEAPAIGLSVRNEIHGLFGVMIPATNYRLRPGDRIEIVGTTVIWAPPLAKDDAALITPLQKFQALRIIKISTPGRS